MVTRQK